MKLTNLMEQPVKARLNQLRGRSDAAAEGCWCPLCRADMMALALSSLPPRYNTRRSGDAGANQSSSEAIVKQVANAVRQVERIPKHPRSVAVGENEQVWVVNFPLEEGFRALEDILPARDVACDCWNCRCDMVAFALNRYPARYGVEFEGRTHLLEGDLDLMRSELGTFLELALRVVSTIPRHEALAPIAADTAPAAEKDPSAAVPRDHYHRPSRPAPSPH